MKKSLIVMLAVFVLFASMHSGCGGSSSTIINNSRDSEVQAYVNELIAEGGLNSDETLPDSTVNYNTSSTAKSLSKSSAVQVVQGETLSPVTLTLAFETDIWNVYVNDTLAASAYSPGVSAGEFKASDYGVSISTSSSSSAQITFSTSAMTTGSNVIAVALVPYVSKPNQVIARTTLGTVTVSAQSNNNTTSNDQSAPTSGDQPGGNPPTSNDQSGNNSNNNSDNNTNSNTSGNLTFSPDSYTSGTVNGVTYRAYTNITYVASPVNESYQRMSIFIPETYISGGTINGYTASTAPIFMPNSVGGYMAGQISSPNANNSAGQALAKGYVVVSPALRGRNVDNGTAPACIVDYKAAVRYLKANKSNLPAGNTDKIISSGTSAGGAISALLGATGNSSDYDTWLDAIGAADATDDIFASMCYCPITNLDHADGAYEWTFGGDSTASTTLASQFISYVNRLGLGYTLNSDGSGTFADYLESTGITLSTYGATRDKTQIPAFDRLDLSSAENNEFGDKHFTDYGYNNNTASSNGMADSAIIKAMNPMNYIGTADTAQYWRIRHGTEDRDTSIAIPALLALKLENSGCTVDFEPAQGERHGGYYDLDELFDWIDSICK